MLIRIATSAALFLYLLGRNTINGNTEEDKDESQIAGAPSELQVHASYDSVQVSWSPPRDDNILIRGYQIGWGINIPDVEKAVVDSTLRQYTIHGLRPNREYVISLRAFNKIGQGFPIYETVKTFSYGKSLTEPPSAHFGDDNQMLSPPVGLLAETLSSSQIHLSWVPNEEAFNEIYTIKYGQSGTNDQFKELNTTEDEHTFDGLKSDTQYEFAVRVANSQEWSLIAVNRTFPAPPSSPPRDLTAIGPQTKKENPDTVTLTWQPPKYANGEIKEYIILYSNDLTSPEREWMMTSVQGDRLSATIHGLFSATIYHFKVQARNVKGYGPFSSVINYTTPKPIVRDFGFDHRFTIEKGEQNISLYQHIMQMFSANLTNILLGAVTVILLVLVIALVIVCSQRKISTNGNGKKTSRQGYIQGRKQSTNCPPINADDLWIQQNGGGRFAALVNNSGTAGGIVYENYDLTTTASDCGQRILLVDHQQRAFIASDSPRPHIESPIPHYQSHYDALRPHQGGPAGTLSRNYLNSALVNPNDAHFHQQQQQSQQTPTTPRNPHIVYARADRQPIAKVDFELEHPSPLMPFHDDSGSFSEISRAGIGGFDKNNCSQLSPPLPVTNTGRNERNSCDYQKLVNQNPPATSMHSFGALDKQQQPKVAHIVRPIVASHTASNSSPSAVRNAVSQLQQQQKTPPLMGQRFTAGGKVPIGRATAQPRVNIANASESPSPYSSVRVQRGSRELDGNGTTTMHLENGGRMPENGQQRKFYQNKSNGSAEELNVQEIDQMIDTLQQLQHEFTNAEA